MNLEMESLGIFEENVDKEEIYSRDETLEIMKTVGALIHTIPGEFTINVVVSIIYNQFVQKNIQFVLRSPGTFYRLVRQYVLHYR
jgi:hypothetical protein